MAHAPHITRYTVGIGFDTVGFVEDALTRRFIDGATILDASGYWRNPDTGKVDAEPSQVLILVHTDPEQFAFEFTRVMEWARDNGEHTVMVEDHGAVRFIEVTSDATIARDLGLTQ